MGNKAALGSTGYRGYRGYRRQKRIGDISRAMLVQQKSHANASTIGNQGNLGNQRPLHCVSNRLQRHAADILGGRHAA
jgi:hypothetical protein